MARRFHIGTAGWAIPSAAADRFGDGTSALSRYATRFDVAEINSSFHRTHRPSTYERWAAATPDAFRFSAKLPKAVTHQMRLVDTREALAPFLDDISRLGAKLGPLLVQCPPSLVFDAGVASAFFGLFRSLHGGRIVCEPRHPTWFGAEAEQLLRDHEVARVAADPARVPAASEPGGWDRLRYLRLHGSPRTYYSSYAADDLDRIAADHATLEVETWCIFDNTASGAACANALDLSASVAAIEAGRRR